MPLQREIIITADGSVSIFVPELNETYHSVHGAMNESDHIFIEAGLRFVMQRQNRINILEVGFGTGLNAFLTACNCFGPDHTIYYIGIEPYPLSDSETEKLNYPELTGIEGSADVFKKIHGSAWEMESKITDNFTLRKTRNKVRDVALPDNTFNLVYFDAFAPGVQPDMWDKAIFEKIYASMRTEGILLTYSCKGDVKRALISCGFAIEKLPGPSGKREFIRAQRSA